MNKISKTKINFWQELLTFGLLLITILTAFTNVSLHKWLSAGIFLAILVHVLLHWRWLATMSKRFFKKMPSRIRLKLVLNIMLILVFLLLTFSGIIVALIYAPSVAVFHNICFYLFISLTTLHLALNWKWITTTSQRVINLPQPTRQPYKGVTQ